MILTWNSCVNRSSSVAWMNPPNYRVPALLKSHEISMVDDRTDSEAEETLYEDSEVTVVQAVLLVFQFIIRHSLSNKTFAELLQLISVLLPTSAKLPTSVHTFKKYLAKFLPTSSVANVHYYCTRCQTAVANSGGACTCGNNSSPAEFVSVPLGRQIQDMMKSNFTVDTCIQLSPL